jgi:hypothetical protein
LKFVKTAEAGKQKTLDGMLVTKLCLFKQETAKTIVTFISFEI